MMRIPTLALLLAASGGLRQSSIVQATTLARMSVADMSRAATIVVRARCVGNSTRWESGEIWTLTAFAVTEAWKGAPPSEITVRTLGGSVSHVSSHVAGVPRFYPGDDVVLFLEPSAAGGLAIVSWQQGTFRIHRDPRTGADAAAQDVAASLLIAARANFSAPQIRETGLEELRRQVTSAARVAQGGRER